MKKMLLLLILLPGLSKAQGEFSDKLATDVIDEATHYAVKRTYWQVFERGNLRKNINTFYRISSIDGELYLDLKVMHGGDVFVVPRNGELELRLENGNILTLYNAEYTASSTGAGARGWAGSSAAGATLSYRISDKDVKTLLHNYVDRIRIYTGDTYYEKRIPEYRSERFMDEVGLVYYSK
jgi:hypothetical protein